MQDAATVLDVIGKRGARGLPVERLYRQMFNPQLYLLAYGKLYANKGAMTPGVSEETVDGMSLAKIGRIIDALRCERYRFQPVKRVYIPKKNGKKRPLGRVHSGGPGLTGGITTPCGVLEPLAEVEDHRVCVRCAGAA